MKIFFTNYKVILIIWIALGLSVSGYLYIFPPQEKHVHISGKWYYRDNDSYYQTTALITVVGSILVGGLGYLLSNRNTKEEELDSK